MFRKIKQLFSKKYKNIKQNSGMTDVIKQSALDIKNNSKKYPSCQYLQSGVTFEFNSIRTCCSNTKGVTYVEDYQGGAVDWDAVQAKRKKYIDDCKKGILPENCRNCVEAEIKEWEESPKIGHIYFIHWDHCNCGCIYCIQLNHGDFLLEEPRKSRFYDAYPLLKDLYDKDLVSKDVHVELVGGDLAVLAETDNIVNLVLDKGVGRFSFHSSMVDYCECIERALKEVHMDFDFAIDCGCSETYKKLKRHDGFEKVKENIKRYTSCHESAGQKMISKFIIVDGINDNIDELEKWLQFTKETGVENCKLDINFQRFFPEFKHKNPTVPAHYYDMYEYFKKRAPELGLKIGQLEYTKAVLEAGGIPDFTAKNSVK